MKALLRKEWMEHRLFALWLALAGAFLFAGLWHEARNDVSPLVAWRGMAIMFGFTAPILLANRLVVREYGAGTQLFLEGLPVARATVLTAKWAAGWCVLLLFFLPALGVALFAARERVYLSAGQAGLIALRSLVFVWLIYAGGFAIALTLRFRFIVWAVLIAVLILVSKGLHARANDWPPMLLVDKDMVLGGAAPPWDALGITAALALGLMGASLWLAAGARGALAVVLARPLSARARTLAAFLVALFGGAMSVLKDPRPAPAFRLYGGVSSTGYPAVQVDWAGPVAGLPPQQLAADLASDTSNMAAWLGLARLARVSVVPDSWREPDLVSYSTENPRHLVVRAALGAPDLPLQRLRAAVRMAHIAGQAPAVAWREDRAWMLAGFGTWWGARGDDVLQRQLAHRAAAAAGLLPSRGMNMEAALRQPDRVGELLGACLDEALAWRAVQTLHERLGEEGFRALMRAALVLPAPNDVRALAAARSTASLLERAGMPLPVLARAVREDIDRQDGASGFAAPTLQVRAVPEGAGAFAIDYQVIGAAAQGLAVRYKLVLPVESKIDPLATYWAGAAPRGVLPATFRGGGTVFVSAEADAPALGCRYRLGAVREVLP